MKSIINTLYSGTKENDRTLLIFTQKSKVLATPIYQVLATNLTTLYQTEHSLWYWVISLTGMQLTAERVLQAVRLPPNFGMNRYFYVPNNVACFNLINRAFHLHYLQQKVEWFSGHSFRQQRQWSFLTVSDKYFPTVTTCK